MTMFARTLVLGLSGLIGLGAACAGDGPSVAAPAPLSAALTARLSATKESLTAKAMKVAPFDFDWKEDEELTRGVRECAPRNPDTATGRVWISMMCVAAPPGFCERSGLATEKQTGPWTLTPRERRMLVALMRAEKEKLELLFQPGFTPFEGRSAVFQPRHRVPTTQSIAIQATDDGKPRSAPTLSTVDLGLTLWAAPKIAANGQIELKVGSELVEPVDAPVENRLLAPKLPPGTPAVSTYSLQTSCVVPNGGTVVIRGAKPGAEVVWVLSAHILDTSKPDAAPAPQAAPVVPAPK